MITFFALLANANEWGEIESFARSKEKWLRKYLDLPSGIPTDAMNCQKETAEIIIKSRGDYVLCLKGNQGNLHTDVAEYFGDDELCGKTKKTGGCYHKTVEKEHGGVATREYYITEDIISLS